MTPEQTAYPAQNSIELSLGSKGLYTWTLKQYHHGDPESIAYAVSNLAIVDGQLRAKYPHPEAGQS